MLLIEKNRPDRSQCVRVYLKFSTPVTLGCYGILPVEFVAELCEIRLQ